MTFRHGVAVFVADGFHHIGIEDRAFGRDFLKAGGREEIAELTRHHAESLENGLRVGRGFGGLKTEFEIVDQREQVAEEGGVGVADGILLLARGAFTEVVEIGCGAQGEVAELFRFGRGIQDGIGRGLGFRFLDRIGGYFVLVLLAHSLRMEMRVMSSCCADWPANSRSSAAMLETVAAAPLGALAWTAWMSRGRPNSDPCASRASVAPSV